MKQFIATNINNTNDENRKETKTMKTFYSISKIKELYTMFDNEFHTKFPDDIRTDEYFEKLHDECDEFGFSKHITCDEIWAILDYVSEIVCKYPIDIYYKGEIIRILYDSNNDYLKMLLVNMLFLVWELEYDTFLNGENIREINRKIDF